MDENKGKSVHDTDTGLDEPDDFARALLEKKTEISLHKELYTEEDLENTQKLYAARSQNSALNRLRAEKGKSPIINPVVEEFKEEEVVSVATAPVKQSETKTPIQEAAVSKTENSEKPEVQKRAESAENKNPVSKPKKAKKKKSSKTSSSKAPQKGTNKSKSKKGKSQRRKKRIFWRIILLALLVLMAGVGVYAYKYMVYDPAHNVSEEQQDAYNKLVAYADEFSTMLDGEKQEIKGLEDQYNSLTKNQKTDIDKYFKEQTGKDFKTLLADFSKDVEQTESAESDEYSDIKSYFEEFANKSDEQKAEVVSYLQRFNALPEDQRNQMNSELYEKLQLSVNDIASKQLDALNEQRADLESELASTQQEFEDATNNGWDTSAYPAYIDDLNTSLNNLNNEISELQNAIGTEAE